MDKTSDNCEDRIDILIIEKESDGGQSPGWLLKLLSPALQALHSENIKIALQSHVISHPRFAARASSLFHFSAIFIDGGSLDEAAFEALSLITVNEIHPPILFFTTSEDPELKIRMIREGASECFTRSEASPEIVNFIMRSIHRKHLAQQAVHPVTPRHASHDLFRKIILHNVDGILILDAKGIVNFANPAAETIFDLPGRALVGRNLNLRIVTDRAMEIDLVQRSGESIQIEIRMVAISWEGKKSFLASVRDITARKRIEQQLIQAKDEAYTASRLKTDFLANVSHEIRTPMNAVLGMAELLFDTPLNEDQNRYLQIISRSGKTLLALINDILDLSKIEAGQLDFETTQFDLVHLVESTIDLLQNSAFEKNLTVAAHFDEGSRRLLTGDPHRIRQILMNLIGNGIKFTRTGRVDVVVTKSGHKTNNVCFEIRDTGSGIAEDKWQNVFSRFTQADTSATRNHGGSGLGLTIVKQLVELMGGKVWLQSEVGKGSSFYFELPLESSEQTQGLQLSQNVASGRSLENEKFLQNVCLFLVETEETSRKDIAQMAGRWGAETRGFDSWQNAAKALRSESQHDKEIQKEILLVTKSSLVSQSKHDPTGVERQYWTVSPFHRSDSSDPRGIATQPHAFFATPLSSMKILRALCDATGRVYPIEASELGWEGLVAAGTASEPVDILLVEDSVDNQALIRGYLRSVPHRLTIAENGLSGVERYKSGRYDIILMDVQMPIMDGLTATQEIRQFEVSSGRPHTPVIALTASALAQDIERSLEVGCDMHVSKPVSRSVLLQAISDELAQYRRQSYANQNPDGPTA